MAIFAMSFVELVVCDSEWVGGCVRGVYCICMCICMCVCVCVCVTARVMSKCM